MCALLKKKNALTATLFLYEVLQLKKKKNNK